MTEVFPSDFQSVCISILFNTTSEQAVVIYILRLFTKYFYLMFRLFHHLSKCGVETYCYAFSGELDLSGWIDGLAFTFPSTETMYLTTKPIFSNFKDNSDLEEFFPLWVGIFSILRYVWMDYTPRERTLTNQELPLNFKDWIIDKG